jgi:hypothetical protein
MPEVRRGAPGHVHDDRGLQALRQTGPRAPRNALLPTASSLAHSNLLLPDRFVVFEAEEPDHGAVTGFYFTGDLERTNHSRAAWESSQVADRSCGQDSMPIHMCVMVPPRFPVLQALVLDFQARLKEVPVAPEKPKEGQQQPNKKHKKDPATGPHA